MTSVTQLTAEDLDPIPGVARRLPGLREALDGARVRPYLLEALGTTEPVGGCRAEQCLYLGDDCLIRYTVDVGGRPTVVTGRLFAAEGACTAFLRESLEPLARRLPERRVAGLQTLVAAVPTLRLALHAFPVDPELPALIDATDPARMLERFRHLVPDALNQPLDISGCTVEPVHYGRRHRCVLRYHVDAFDAAGSRYPMTVYGKVAATAEGALAAPVINALRARGEVRVPRSLGYLPDQRLALFEGIPGRPRVAQLLRERLADTSPTRPTSPTLEDALDSCGGVAARLHASGIELGPLRRLADDLAALRRTVPLVAAASPGLAERLDAWLTVVETRAGTDQPALGLAHGDYSYTQLIFDGNQLGLVDFDTVCQGEPALDLGHFLAYLDLAGRKGGGPDRHRLTGQMRGRFLSTYVDHRGLGDADARRLIDRTAVYELVSLLRLAIHAWQKLKARRLRLVVDAIEERMSLPNGDDR